MTRGAAKPSTVDEREIERFSALADSWWDTRGEFRLLHRLNPLRMAYIRDQVCARFGRDAKTETPFAGLDILDVGCGGGILAEPLSRLGANVSAVDAGAEMIRVAQNHAADQGLVIDYRCCTDEELAAEGKQFDVVVTMEVVEHVADLDSFLDACATLVKPGGLLLAATLNRTPKSFALAIVGAEYILRWVPRGTHAWEKFVTPAEFRSGVQAHGLRLSNISGVTYNPLSGNWSQSQDVDVNYMIAAEKD